MYFTNLFPDIDDLDIDGAKLVSSSSRQSAGITPPIVLREPSDHIRFEFRPIVHSNENHPENGVQGSFIYEKRGKHDDGFPTDSPEKVSRRSVHVGDSLELRLDSSETMALYRGLQELYQLRSDMEEIPLGEKVYIPMDAASLLIIKRLKRNWHSSDLLNDPDTLHVVEEVVNFLSRGNSLDDIRDALHRVEAGGLHQISAGVNLELLTRASQLIRNNLDNGDERFWQKSVLEENPWILEQLFSSPYVVFNNQPYVGGKAHDNTGGNYPDFLCRNRLTNNTAIVEIKTPCTRLLKEKPYRHNSYPLSRELSGAVSQVLVARQDFMGSIDQLYHKSGGALEALSPRCIILIGKLSELEADAGVDEAAPSLRNRFDQAKLASFEIFRNSVNGIEIVTYDELLERIDGLIQLFSMEPADCSDGEDVPF